MINVAPPGSDPVEIKLRAVKAAYRATCPACGEPYFPGDSIVRDFTTSRWIHETCYTDQEKADQTKHQTLDEHYNALCQALDRIVTGNPKIIARGGARSSVAETLRDADSALHGDERVVVRFDHRRIKAWSKNGYDRTALTLALNIHELGHIWHSPAASGAGRRKIDASVRRAFNMLEDQRQEILTALQYPRAVDYLRYLNARGLQLAIQDGFIGRSYLLQYGRRHLYPPSINSRLRAEALAKYGQATTMEIERIIDEFLRLALPQNLNRAWQLARLLANIDQAYDPPWNSKEFEIGDPRHDCVPTSGEPTLDPGTRDRLTRKIRKLVQRPSATKEPEHKEPPKEQASDEVDNQSPTDDRPELSSDSDDGDADPTGEPAGNDDQLDNERTPETSDEPPESAKDEEGELESEPELEDQQGSPEGPPPSKEEMEPDKEEDSETLDRKAGEENDDDADSQSGEGDDDASSETEAGSDEEVSDEEGNDASSDSGESEDEGPVAEAEVEQADDDSGTGAGRGSSPKEVDEKLTEALEDLENAALDQVKDEIQSRHVALKSSELMPSLGGNRRGALNPLYRDAARRTGRLFEDINQDLKAVTRRGQRRGRLDSRRIITSITSNNLRIFKRRVKDLTPEAALAVHIFIDTSGSMNEPVGANGATKMEIALPAGFALAKAIEHAGHLAKVTTFADGCTEQKDWLDECYRVSALIETGGTFPAEGLKKAIPSFIYVEKELDIHNHVLILITDGELSDPESSTKYLKQMVDAGVYVIEIGIETNPTPLHGAWKIMNIKSVDNLSKALADPLAKLSVEIAKNVRRKIA